MTVQSEAHAYGQTNPNIARLIHFHIPHAFIYESKQEKVRDIRSIAYEEVCLLVWNVV